LNCNPTRCDIIGFSIATTVPRTATEDKQEDKTEMVALQQGNRHNEHFKGVTRHVDKSKKIKENDNPPLCSSASSNTAITTIGISRRKGPVSTSTKQSMSYVTVKGIESEISYLESDWAKFAVKELMDNAYDFLNDFYGKSPKEARKIAVRIWCTPKHEGSGMVIIHIAVRNSNIDNIKIFENLESMFDYNIWYSSKRHQHRMICGYLGDFLKRSLGMGYASWTYNHKPEDSFEDKQWDEPLILRFNGHECRAMIRVDRDNQHITAQLDKQQPHKLIDGNETEVEIALPIPASWWICTSTSNNKTANKLFNKLERYYKIYKAAKSRTHFSLDIIEKLQEEGGENQ
jgi:hypothetical protein